MRVPPGLAGVAAERVREELALTLAHSEAYLGVELLARLEVYPRLWLGEAGNGAAASKALAILRALPAAAERLRALAPGSVEALDLAAAHWAATTLPPLSLPRRSSASASPAI